MSKFFQKVTTPETRLRQSKAPSGPDVDVNARAEIQNKLQNNLGAAINDVLGTVGAVVGTIKEVDEKETQRQLTENKHDITKDTQGYSDFMTTFKYKDKLLSEITDEDELSNAVKEGTQAFGDSKNIQDSNYALGLRRTLQEKGTAFYEYQFKRNRELKKDQDLTSAVNDVIDSMRISDIKDVDVLSKYITDERSEDLGLGENLPRIKNISKEEYDGRMLQALLEYGFKKGDSNFLALLSSKKMEKVFSSVKGYQKGLTSLRREIESTNKGIRASNFSLIEEEILPSVMGGMTSVADAKIHIAQKIKLLPEEQRPSKLDTAKLIADLEEIEVDNVGYEQYRAAIEKGERPKVFGREYDIKEKQLDSWSNRHVIERVKGLENLSAESIETLLLGENKLQKQQFKTALKELPIAFSMREYGRNIQFRSPEEAMKRWEVFQEFDKILDGTGRGVDDIYDPDEKAKIFKIGRLQEDLENGVITQEAHATAIRDLIADPKKNVNSFGVHVSPYVTEAMKSENYQEIKKEYMEDASFTIDPFSDQYYRGNEFDRLYSIHLNHYQDEALALEKTEVAFEKNNKSIETPDGKEVTIPRDYFQIQDREFDENQFNDAIIKIALFESKNTESPLHNAMKAAGFLGIGIGKKFDFTSSLGFLKARDYYQTKRASLTYNGRPFINFTPKEFLKHLKMANDNIKEMAEKRNIERIKSGEKIDRGYKFR